MTPDYIGEPRCCTSVQQKIPNKFAYLAVVPGETLPFLRVLPLPGRRHRRVSFRARQRRLWRRQLAEECALGGRLGLRVGDAERRNPVAQQLDFYIRSPARNEDNHPNREVFDHFFAMEVTWK